MFKKFTFERFNELSKEFLHSGRFLWHICGNITKEDAIKTANMVVDEFNLEPISRSSIIPSRTVKLEPGVHYRFQKPNQDKDNKNSGVVSYYQYKLLINDADRLREGLIQ